MAGVGGQRRGWAGGAGGRGRDLFFFFFLSARSEERRVGWHSSCNYPQGHVHLVETFREGAGKLGNPSRNTSGPVSAFVPDLSFAVARSVSPAGHFFLDSPVW